MICYSLKVEVVFNKAGAIRHLKKYMYNNVHCAMEKTEMK